MAMNSFSNSNGHMTGHNGHRRTGNSNSMHPDCMYHIHTDSAQEFLINMSNVNKSMNETFTPRHHSIGMEEKIFKFLEHMRQENKHELRRFGEKMDHFMGTVNEQVSKIEESISRGWCDVHNYSATSANSSMFYRRDCSSYMEEETVANTEGSQFDPVCANMNSVERGNIVPEVAEISRDVYAFSSNQQEERNTFNNHDGAASVLLASVTLDRRRSNSTITTLESGYCEDREEVFENSNEGHGHVEYFNDDRAITNYNVRTDGSCQQQSSSNSNDKKHCGDSNAIQLNNGDGNNSTGLPGTDADIQIVDVVNGKESQKTSRISIMSPPIISRNPGMQVSQRSHKENRNVQRTSVFSNGLQMEGPRVRIPYEIDLDDSPNDNDSITVVRSQILGTPSLSLEDDTTSINGIFNETWADTGAPTMEDHSTSSVIQALPPSSNKRKKASGNNKEPKRIRGIIKAPIKAEPLTHHSSSSSQSPPVLSLPEGLLVTLRNIKKERVAHAVDRYEPPIDGNESGGLWYCICGHTTNTKSGLNSHVKHSGNEERRFKCLKPGCKEKFLYPHHVRNHIFKDHSDIKVPRKLHGCDKCFNVFLDKNNLRTHLNKRNQICKHASRRRSHPAKTVSIEQPVLVPPRAHKDSTPKRPSIIITL